jgi:hypothetical protein
MEGVIKEQAENCVFGAVRQLPNQEVNDRESVERKVNVQREEKLRQKPACNGTAESRSGKH